MFSLISPRGFRRADSDGSSSHFQHHVSQAPPNGSPTNQRSQSFESERRGPAPQPLPRRSLVRSLKKIFNSDNHKQILKYCTNCSFEVLVL